MRRAVRIGLAVFSLLLISLVIALFSMDLGRFKPLITDFASSYLERSINIDGPLSIEVGRKLRVSGEFLRVASEDWTEADELASIERFSVTMDAWSLVKGIVLVDAAEASGIKAHLAVNDQGNDNWTFAGLAADDEEPTTPVVIRRAAISDATILYSMPQLPTISLAVSTLDLHERADQGLHFELTGAVNETPLQSTGDLGSADELIEGQNIPFAISGDLGEINFAAEGMIDDLYDPRRPKVDVSMQGPNAEYLTGILGVEPLTTGPFAFQASAVEAQDVLSVQVDGTYGEFDLNLTAQVTDLQTPGNLNLNAHADGPSIGTIARLAGQTGAPELPFTVDARIQMSGQALEVEQFLFDLDAATVEASASLPSFPGLDGAKADLLAAGPQFGNFTRLLGLPGALTGPFEAALTLDRADSGSVLDARLESEALQATARGRLTDDPALIGSAVSVTLSGDDAARIAAVFEAQGVPSEPFSASADLTLGAMAIDITNGVATLADVAVGITGSVAQDPFSPATRLQLTSEIVNLAETLTAFGVAIDGLPQERLTLDVVLRGGEDEIHIDPLIARLGEIDARVTARLGNSLALPDMTADFEITATSLSGLMPFEDMPISDAPFRAAARLSFVGEDGMDVQMDDLEVDYGPASARGALNLYLTDPLAAGQIRIEAESASLSQIVPSASEFVGTNDAFSIVGGGRWQEDGLRLDDTTIRIGDININVRGELHPPPQIAGTMLTLDASLPSLRILELAAGQPLPDEPLTIRADLVAEADTLRLSTFELKLGQSDLTGTAAFKPAAEANGVPEFTAELSSSLLDLRPLQVLSEADALEPEQVAEPEDGRLIPDMPVPLEPLGEVNGAVLLTLNRVMLNNTTLTGVEFDGSIKEGALLIERFVFGGEDGGKLSGSLQLTPTDSGADFSLTADGEQMIVGLPAKTEEAIVALPRYELRTRLAASGLTVREMASSSRGYLRLVAGEGRVSLGPITALMGDFVGEVFDSVNPFAKKETDSAVQCMAVLVEINDGVIRGEPAVVLQTDKLNIVGAGRVDLSSEKLNAKFNTQARKGIGIGLSDLVSPLTEIGGTLGSPRLQLNTTGTLVEGGAAVATVGISFLAKKARDRWFSDKNPCRTAIADADRDLEEGRVPLSEPTRPGS